jgi:hypothetical protein
MNTTRNPNMTARTMTPKFALELQLGACIPKAPKLPSDAGMLLSSAVLSFCPAPRAERRARSLAIGELITSALLAG